MLYYFSFICCEFLALKWSYPLSRYPGTEKNDQELEVLDEAQAGKFLFAGP